jgi:hypothetical protein
VRQFSQARSELRRAGRAEVLPRCESCGRRLKVSAFTVGTGRSWPVPGRPADRPLGRPARRLAEQEVSDLGPAVRVVERLVDQFLHLVCEFVADIPSACHCSRSVTRGCGSMRIDEQPHA